MTYDVKETPINVKLLNPNGSVNSAMNPCVISSTVRTFDMVFEGDDKMIELVDNNGVPVSGFSNYFSHLMFEIDAADSSMRFITSSDTESKLLCKPTYVHKYQINRVNIYSTFTDRSSVLSIYLDGVANPVKSQYYIKIVADLVVEINEGHAYYEGEDNEYIFMSLNYDTSRNNNNNYMFSSLFNIGAGSGNLLTIKDANNNQQKGSLSLTDSQNYKLEVDSSVAVVEDYLGPDEGYFTIKEDYLIYTGTGVLSNLRKNFDIYIYYVADDLTTVCYSQKLKIYINPTYTIDATKINSNNPANLKSIFNGTDLYESQYIQVYNGMSLSPDKIVDATIFKSKFNIYIDCNATDDDEYNTKLSALSGGTNKLYLSGSLLNLNKTLPEDLLLKLNLEYPLNSNNAHRYEGHVEMFINLIGMELYIDEEGEFDDATQDYETITSAKNGEDPKYPNQIDFTTNFNTHLMEFEVNNGETIDINKFMKIYSAENGSHYIPGTADLLRIEWDSNIALQDLSIELNFDQGVTGYYQKMQCNLAEGTTEAKVFDINVYVIAYSYDGDLQYTTLYKLGFVRVTINP